VDVWRDFKSITFGREADWGMTLPRIWWRSVLNVTKEPTEEVSVIILWNLERVQIGKQQEDKYVTSGISRRKWFLFELRYTPIFLNLADFGLSSELDGTCSAFSVRIN
jgi:hypothetical protein